MPSAKPAATATAPKHTVHSSVGSAKTSSSSTVATAASKRAEALAVKKEKEKQAKAAAEKARFSIDDDDAADEDEEEDDVGKEEEKVKEVRSTPNPKVMASPSVKSIIQTPQQQQPQVTTTTAQPAVSVNDIIDVEKDMDGLFNSSVSTSTTTSTTTSVESSSLDTILAQYGVSPKELAERGTAGNQSTILARDVEQMFVDTASEESSVESVRVQTIDDLMRVFQANETHGEKKYADVTHLSSSTPSTDSISLDKLMASAFGDELETTPFPQSQVKRADQPSYGFKFQPATIRTNTTYVGASALMDMYGPSAPSKSSVPSQYPLKADPRRDLGGFGDDDAF